MACTRLGFSAASSVMTRLMNMRFLLRSYALTVRRNRVHLLTQIKSRRLTDGAPGNRATNQAFLHVRADKVTHMIDWPEFEDAPEFGKIALSGHWGIRCDLPRGSS